MSCRRERSSSLQRRIPKPPVLRHPDHVAQLARGQTEFAWKLYKACRSHPLINQPTTCNTTIRPTGVTDGTGDTLCLSPLLLHQALCSGYAGARRQSSASLRAVLQLPTSDAELSLAYADTNRALQAAAVPQLSAALPQLPPSQLPHELHAAARLFLPITHCLLDQFATSLRSAFASDLAKLPFHTDRERARLEINQWAEEATEQHVPQLLRPLALPATFVSMVLASVLYFRGAWAKRVRANARIELGLFRGVANKTHQTVPCVRLDAVLRWGVLAEADARLLELPYEDERFSLLIILPDHSLEETEGKLSGAQLCRLDEALQERSRLRVRLPVFGAGEPLSLGAVLRESEGLAPLFARGQADFSGVSGNNNLHLSHVEHAARFELRTADFRRKGSCVAFAASPSPAAVKKSKGKEETNGGSAAVTVSETPETAKKSAKEKIKKAKKDKNGEAAKVEETAKATTPATTTTTTTDGDAANANKVVNNVNDDANGEANAVSSAASFGKVGNANAQPQPPPLPPRKPNKSQFEVDRPFLFVVLDNYLRMLLVLGCVRNLSVSKPSD